MSGALNASAIAAAVELPTSTLTATDFELHPSSATAWLQFRNDGAVYDQDNSKRGDWILPNGAAPDDYEIRANSSSPDTPDSGTMDTWLALSSSRTWSESRSGVGIDSKTFTVDIRKGSSGDPLITRTCTLTADVDI